MSDFIDYDDDGNEIYECWQCFGVGQLAGCFEDTCSGADCDPDAAEWCCAPTTCDICQGEGRYVVKPEAAE